MNVLRDLAEERIRVSEAATLMGLGRRQVLRLAKAFRQRGPTARRGRPRHRGGVASAITCSRPDKPEQGRLGRRLRYLGAPRAARTGATLQPRNQERRLPFSPKIVAKNHFSNRRRQALSRPPCGLCYRLPLRC
ncbi:MAG TPA: helix-turn-helix domain-containing protein [Xanthobacteraceae bacterium]